MRSITESIIGKRGGDYKSSKIPGDLYLWQDLEYGDVVLWGANTYYIYLPYSQWKSWWKSSTRKPQELLVRYSPSNVHRACYNYDFTCNYKFVRYVEEYKTIHTIDDLKRIFDKYNIPYE